MHTIVMANQKGGAGKTTLASHMAVQASLSGIKAPVVMDFDPQRGLAEWFLAREAQDLRMVNCEPKELKDWLVALKEAGTRLVIIDTPGAVGPLIKTVVSHASLVVVPCKPSPNDFRAVGNTVALLETLSKRMVFVVNEATARARLTGSAAIELSQHGTVCPVIVPKRESYRLAMVDGHATQEVDPAAQEEMKALWSYLAAQLKREAKR